MTPQVYLRKGKEESLMRRHPWIFSGAIDHIKAEDESEITEGALVEIYTRTGDFIALGHYQIGSIAVRVLTFDKEPIDQDWWNRRIAVAYDVRRTLGLTDNPDTDCYRLVHGEGDGLPGLVVDIYGTVAVIQCHSVGMYLARQDIARAILAAYGDRITAIYDKSSQTVPFNAKLGAVDGYLWGSSDHSAHVVTENGEKFLVNWEQGQKTGFFLDQRENRELVKRYSKGRTVLNTFCYTGGFSVYAMAGGAEKVCSVDSSERAVVLATENMKLNFGPQANFTGTAADAVEYLKDIEDKYDLIILDPPAFAKHHKVLGNAMQGYKRLNARAISQITPRRHPLHVLLLAGGVEGAVPHDDFLGRGHRGPQRAHPAPADAARRPPGEHLPPRRRVPQGTGVVCRIGKTAPNGHGKNRTPDLRPLPDPPYRRPLRGQVVAAGTLQPPYERVPAFFGNPPPDGRHLAEDAHIDTPQAGTGRAAVAQGLPRGTAPRGICAHAPRRVAHAPPHSAYRVGRGKFRRHPRRPGAGKDIATARVCPANQARYPRTAPCRQPTAKRCQPTAK